MALTVLAGQIILADDFNKLVPVTAEKSTTTSRASTTTATDDPHLVLALNANITYNITGSLLVTSAANAAGDFVYGWSFPSGAEVRMGGDGPHNSLASGSQVDGEWTYFGRDSTTPTGTIPYGTSTAGININVRSRIVMGSTAGNLTLIWAQQTSNANNTNLLDGSWITATPVL